MAVPRWALDLAAEVARDEGRDAPPKITWWRRKDILSSGREFDGDNRVHVTAGTLRRDQKRALLHELAHWLCPAKENHGPLFWDTAWRLFLRYKMPIGETLEREGAYRHEAIEAARRAGIRVSGQREKKIAASRRPTKGFLWNCPSCGLRQHSLARPTFNLNCPRCQRKGAGPFDAR